MPDGLLRVIATGSASSYSSSDRTGADDPTAASGSSSVGRCGGVHDLHGDGKRAGRVQERLGADVGDPAREQRDELALDVGRVARDRTAAAPARRTTPR